MRADEAKLCGRVRGECLSTLGVSILTFPPSSSAPAVVVLYAFFMLYSWVLILFAMLMGFFIFPCF